MTGEIPRTISPIDHCLETELSKFDVMAIKRPKSVQRKMVDWSAMIGGNEQFCEM